MTRTHLKQLEDDPLSAVDSLRVKSDIEASEYATPVLGLSYRRYESAIQAEFEALKSGRLEKPIHESAPSTLSDQPNQIQYEQD